MKITQKLRKNLKSLSFKHNSHFEEVETEAERMSFSELCENLRQITGLTTSASTNLNKLLLDFEDYGAESWKREMATRKKYFRVINSLFLILDHFENFTANNEKSEEINWVYKGVQRILDDEDIEEIPIEIGEPFNGKYHKSVGSHSDDLEAETVSEVSRKGYLIKGQPGQEDAILRPAEVIVSNGPMEKQSEKEITEE